jgi:hypothetical protein
MLTALCLFIVSFNIEKKKEEGNIPETEMTFETNMEDIKISVENFNKFLVEPKKGELEKSCADELTYGRSS